MEIQQMRAWSSVVELGSVRSAAASLGYSPSAISQQITQLQREVGVPLMMREGRGIRPTPQGEALAERINTVLLEFDGLETSIRVLKTDWKHSLKLGYFASIGATWIPELLAQISTHDPAVQVELVLVDEFDPMLNFQIVVQSALAAVPSGYRKELLARDPFVAVVPEGHPLSRLQVVSLERLAEFPWIDNDPSAGPCRQIVLDACMSRGFQPEFQMQLPDYSSALALVAKGLGITVLPQLAVQQGINGANVIPITPPAPAREIYVVIPDSAQKHLPTELAFSLIKKIAKTGRA